ncbi:iron (metal) dependent repressor, DtxR family [Ekhidna lutea]|uniref:Transcriptional regulator MntR n=1 Tax=Ekhidna lutea TaxID=447679 RepID=A0A239H913_EKHLU|nr:metal-dependent transcriptional regulator [Ekhidna lutea]SNS76744.1 iron (metal) dependent repressor, DtxR family [Ekhidna lutea]
MISELSFTEENYLKAIFHLSSEGTETVNTNSLAESMSTTPASVNDMVKRLAQKKLIGYQKYKGATLLPKGKKVALTIIRKHRLWEVFLVEKLEFKWDEVHEIAEQLEHIKSPTLIKKLDKFLGFPTMDPHGDPIPDEDGVMKASIRASISDVNINSRGIVVAVNNDDTLLLQHLDSIGIKLGSRIHVIDRMEFDGSVSVTIDDGKKQFISKPVAENLMITITDTK